MKRKPNPAAFVSLLALLVLLGAAVHFVHGFQTQRNAVALLQQATRLEEQGKFNQAAEALYRYVQFVPGDDEAYARYGLLVEKQARSLRARARAFEVLDQVVRRNPDRADVRNRLVRLAIGLERFSDALTHLNVLLKNDPKNGELMESVGQCEEGNSQFSAALKAYAQAITYSPERIDCYVRQASLLRRHLQQPEQADAIMEQLVKVNPQSFRAYLEQARYQQGLNHVNEAAKAVGQALVLAPKESDVLLAASAIALGRPNADPKSAQEESRKYLLLGVELHPKDGRMYEGLARLALVADRRDEAIQWIQKLKPLSESPEVLWGLALLWIDAGEMEEARETVRQLEKAGFAPASLGYAEAHIHVKENQWLKAVRALEKARPLLARFPDLSLRGNLLLGRCYEQLGSPDQQVAAYRQAVSLNPLSDEARLGLASALAAAGRIDEAVGEYRRLLPRRPGLRLAMLRLLLLRQASAAADQRNWAEIDALMEEAAELTPEPVEVPVYRADAQALKEPGQLGKARAILDAAQPKHGKQPLLWVSRAIMMDRQGETSAALALLDQAIKELGDSVDFRLARARIVLRGPGAPGNVAKQVTALEKDLAKLSPEDQARVLAGIADACFRAGDSATAERLWSRLASLQPDSLRVRRLQLDLAIQAENADTVRRLAGELRRIEGEDGVLWRFAEASHLVLRARKGQLQGLAEARSRVTEISTRRPNWARSLLLQAQIDELQDNLEQAIESYLRAIELGEQHPALIRRTVQLLFGRRRFAEADQILRRLQEANPLGGEFERMAAEVSLFNRDRERALELARKAVTADSKDYRDHLWLGQMLAAGRDLVKAEESLRRAAALGPQAPETWVALVGFLASQNQKEKAAVVVREAEVKLPKAELPLALAYCYEVVGQFEKADFWFVTLRKTRGDDAATLQTVANYQLRRGEVAKAEPLLRKILAPETRASAAQQSVARRTLALGLIAAGGYRRTQEALELLNHNLSGRKNTEDVRAKAVALASQPGTRREAIRIYEDLASRQTATPGDQFALAQLYDLEGNTRRAGELMINVLASHGENPVFVAYYAGSLLRRKSVDQAEVWVEKLEKLRPAAWRTVELRAQILKARGEIDPAAKLVEKHAESPDANLALVAQMLEELGRHVTAEALLRKLVATGKQPDSLVLLALFLGRRQRTGEALELCEQAWQATRPETVADAVVVLVYAARDGERYYRRAAEQLEAARRNHPQSLAIAFQLANLFDLSGNAGEAEKRYREILAKNQSTSAMNNLAWLLAMRREKLPEALTLINKAIELDGPAPGLLDTRGMIYFAMGQLDAAIQDLQTAVTRAPSSATFFRLARAHHASKNTRAATEALDMAQAAGLTPLALHHSERPAYEEQLNEIRRRQ